MKRRHILDVLAQVNGNKTKAAEMLGVKRQSFQQMLKRLEVEGYLSREAPSARCRG